MTKDIFKLQDVTSAYVFKYFITESPDFNNMIYKGRIERIATNRVVLCIMTEFGLCNNRRMMTHEYNSFVETIQMTTGSIREESKVFLKTIPLYFTSITLPNTISIECVS